MFADPAFRTRLKGAVHVCRCTLLLVMPYSAPRDACRPLAVRAVHQLPLCCTSQHLCVASCSRSHLASPAGTLASRPLQCTAPAPRSCPQEGLLPRVPPRPGGLPASMAETRQQHRTGAPGSAGRMLGGRRTAGSGTGLGMAKPTGTSALAEQIVTGGVCAGAQCMLRPAASCAPLAQAQVTSCVL